ncbi:MAG TPA: glycosyltransferase [Thermodesulfobacteriota bacterium]
MGERVRVLHLVQGLEVGGLEYMVVNLIKGLDNARYAPAVCCFDGLGSLESKLRGVDVHLLRRRQGVDYAYPFRLAALLRRERTQILHLHNPTAYFYGALAGAVARVPLVVYTEHARDIRPNMKIRVADKLLSFFTDRVVAVAGHVKRNLVEYEWFNPSKVRVIYNGIDDSRFSAGAGSEARAREALGIGESVPIIGIVARLDPIKNHRCLIKAMRLVVDAFPGALLLVVGDGPLRGELEEESRATGLGDNVRFLGTRADVESILRSLDVFVLSSVSEGLPLTVLEAMAAGRPIVATRVGGIPEAIEDGVDGLLVPPDDERGLAAAIKGMLADKKRAGEMARSARKKFEKSFSLRQMISNYEEVYSSAAL